MLYLRPISSWITEELKRREEFPEVSIFKMPFAILTSAAIVAKNITLDDALNFQGDSGTTYRGCIIGNILDTDKQYGRDIIDIGNPNRTIVGIDFDGKHIVTEGETERRKPIPIIESIEIDTDGQNNALKTANVTIRCFTLKQLEMFELFYCRPGVNLLLEFGNNFEITSTQIDEYKRYMKTSSKSTNSLMSNIAQTQGKTATDLKSIIVPKTNYKEYIETTYKKYYAMSENKDAEWLTKILKSNGQYDTFAGKVTNFSYSFNEDGTYEVSIEITAMNMISMALPANNVSDMSRIGVLGPAGRKLSDNEIILKALQQDFNIPQLDVPLPFVEQHTFNFIRPADTKKDQHASEKCYISLHFILKYFVNYITTVTALEPTAFDINFKKAKVGGKEVDAIVCMSHKKIISSSEDVIFPGFLPRVKIGNKKPKVDNVILDDKDVDDARIHNLSFNFTEKDIILTFPDYTAKSSVSLKEYGFENSGDFTLGNALNIFVNYEAVLEAWRKATTRADFLSSILQTINDNSYNLFNLITAPNTSNGGFMTVQDANFRKLNGDVINLLGEDKVYRFKVGTINSIVKSFSFQMELSSLIAGQTVFQRTCAIEDVLNKVAKGEDSTTRALQSSISQNALYTNYRNADGFISADGIEAVIIKETVKKNEAERKRQEEAKKKAEAADKSKDDKKKENVTEQEPSDTAVIDDKVIRFKNGTKSTIYILTDSGVALNSMNLSAQKDEGTLSDFSVTLVIDGLSGLSCGELFRVDGIPEIYNKTGAFQIMNVKHTIDNKAWDTTIEATWRIIKIKSSTDV